MENKNSKFAIGMVALFELILIVTGIFSFLSRQWKNLSLCLLASVCLLLPFVITYLANIKKVLLPPSFQWFAVLFIFSTQYLGEIRKFYHIFGWWDLLLHSIFGVYGVIIALYLIQGNIKRHPEATKKRFLLFTVIFAFNFSITLGTLWEIFEFVGDYLFKASMVKGGLKDTATDILVTIGGAFATSVVYYHRNLKK